ncbi:MAG: hypothetical protein ACJAUQ_000434, partial [Maribacter sp.]
MKLFFKNLKGNENKPCIFRKNTALEISFSTLKEKPYPTCIWPIRLDICFPISYRTLRC